MTGGGFTLVGDGIENPHNAMALVEIAAVLGAACVFLDRKQVCEGARATYPEAGILSSITLETLAAQYRPIIACETLPDAVDLFGCRSASGERPAVVVGNERLGITHRTLALASRRIRIPLAARGIDSLNVAASAAVALYYLRNGSGPMRERRHPAAHRPDLLLLAAGDHVELGCAIRSAAAFGWGRLLVEDRAGVWFDADRRPRSEGRAAARQSKNSIVILPAGAERRYAYDEAVVICTAPTHASVPLYRANLARGGRQLIVLPDEGAVDPHAESWARLGRLVRFVHLGLPEGLPVCRYRAPASIAMAEVARQVGRAGVRVPGGRSSRPCYDRVLDLVANGVVGEVVPFGELLAY